MDVSIKEYGTVIAASIAAIASIITLALNTRLTLNREKRRALWDKELERFVELEEVAGKITEDLMSHRCREEDDKEVFYQHMQYLRVAAGRFRRYPAVAQSIRCLSHDAGWYFGKDMKHESKEEYEEARNNLLESYSSLIKACDEALGRPKK